MKNSKDSVEITVQESGQQSAGATVENDPRFCGFSESEQQSGDAFACLVGFPLGAAAVGALIGLLIQSAREGSKSDGALYGALAAGLVACLIMCAGTIKGKIDESRQSNSSFCGLFQQPASKRSESAGKTSSTQDASSVPYQSPSSASTP